jgi:hypothetical protein
MDIEEFANYVEVAVTADEHGRERALHASYRYCDPRTGECHEAQRSVDLEPYIAAASQAFADYHRQLHGADPDITTSGWFDSVVNVAKSVAHSDIVQSVYHTVTENPVARAAIGALPGGGTLLTAVDTAKAVVGKAKDVVNQAVKGDQGALAKVVAVKQLAQEGHPEAQQTVAIMQQHLNEMTARSLGRARGGGKHGSFYDRGLGRGDLAPTAANMPPLVPVIPGAPGSVVDRNGNPMATPIMPSAVDSMAAANVPGHTRSVSPQGMAFVNGHWERARASAPPVQASGWLYNVPYRDAMSYMADPVHAPAIAARSLYRSGISTSPGGAVNPLGGLFGGIAKMF